MNTTRKTDWNSLKVQFLVHKNEGLFEIFVDETQKHTYFTCQCRSVMAAKELMWSDVD